MLQPNPRGPRAAPVSIAAPVLIAAIAGMGSGCGSTRRATPPPPPEVGGYVRPAARGEPAPPLATDAGLDRLIERAVTANPGIRAAYERWLAALDMAPQVGILPDPVFGARYFIEEVQTRVGPQDYAVGLSQRLPWFGRLDLREEVALARAEAQRARYEAAVLFVVEEVRTAWYELFYLEQAVATVRENKDLLVDLEEVLRTRYAAGQTTYADLLRAQVELGRLDDRLESLEDRRRPAVARLNAVLHRPPDAPIATPRTIRELGTLRATEELRDGMLTSNPGLRALLHEREAAERGIELADLEQKPDVTVGVEYIDTGDALNPGVPGSGDDPIMASISFTLPIRGERYRAVEREARARHRAALASIDAEMDRLHSALETELFLARDAERQVGLYRDTLVPRARQSFEATETAFRSGDASFLDLIDAERVLLEFELSLERARTDRVLAIARLERLVGAPVTAPAEAGAPDSERAEGDER